MPKHIIATEVSVKEGFEPIEIEVFVSYYAGNLLPFVSAHVVGSSYKPYVPNNTVNERYTFKVDRPTEAIKELGDNI